MLHQNSRKAKLTRKHTSHSTKTQKQAPTSWHRLLTLQPSPLRGRRFGGIQVLYENIEMVFVTYFHLTRCLRPDSIYPNPHLGGKRKVSC